MTFRLIYPSWRFSFHGFRQSLSPSIGRKRVASGTRALVRPGLIQAVSDTEAFVVRALIYVNASSAVRAETETCLTVTSIGAPQISTPLLTDVWDLLALVDVNASAIPQLEALLTYTTVGAH